MTDRMRWGSLGLGLTFLLAAGCSARPTPPPPAAPTPASPALSSAPASPTDAIPPDVRQELIELGRADQAIRQGLTPERFADTTFARRMIREDSARTARLREIVRQYGWPGPARAGKEAANAAFLIVQHSGSLALQQQVLPTLDSLARAGELPKQDVALLTDRVLKAEGKPQRYGTQFDLVGGKFVMYRVEDEDALDERRAAMGLPPMSEYMRMMEQMYHAPVVRHP